MLLIVFLILVIMGIVSSAIIFFLPDVKPIAQTINATDVMTDMMKDPLVTSRVYFSETIDGPVSDVIGYSPVSQDDWLHSLPHKEPQDERGKYDNIRRFIQTR